MSGDAEKKPRMLLVTHYFAEQGGGIERVAAQLARQLTQSEYQVTWAASNTRSLDESRHAATRCVAMSAWDGIQRATGAPWPVWGPGGLLKLWGLVGEASVVHLHDCLYFGNAFAFLFARLRRKPVVVTQHVSDVPFQNPLLKLALRVAYQSLGRMVLGGADQVVFISEVVQNDFLKRFRFRNPPCFLPNGVDSSLFTPADDETRQRIRRELFGTNRDCVVFIFAGRFVEKKGLSVLRRISAALPNHRFVLIGQGPVDPGTWELGNVSVVEALPQCELARYYQAGDALVLPSVGEGLPLVVQEAMSTGLTVMVSSRTARADSSVSRYLLHAPCTDELEEDEVVSKWIELLDRFDVDTARTLVRRHELCAVARQRWSWESCAAAYANVFQRVSRQR